MKIAILYNPGHNRVYFKTAKALAREELACLRLPVCDVREEVFGGLEYLCFALAPPGGEGAGRGSAPAALPENVLRQLSRLSFAYGIFRVEGSDLGAVLAPMEFAPGFRFDESLTTILKYTGKTNELFTRMLVNIAAGFGNFTRQAAILDPLCGKGTTVFEGLLQGFTNVCGIEADEKILHEAYVFCKKYLEREKVKHSSHIERIGVPESGRGRAKRYRISGKMPSVAAASAEAAAAEVAGFQAEFVAGDTRDGLKFFGKNKFDAIIGDLPYGIQHSRKSPALLPEALPVWHKLLKPGGVLVLAWNLFLIPREEMLSALEAAGFKPQTTGDFRHRVDQAIERDVIIGKK